MNIETCRNLLRRHSDIECQLLKGHEGWHKRDTTTTHFEWLGTQADICPDCKGRGTVPTPDLFAGLSSQ